MIQRALHALRYYLWGTTRRPWWLHRKRERQWRFALTVTLLDLGG